MKTRRLQATAAEPKFLSNPALGKAAAALAVFEGLNMLGSRSQDFINRRVMYVVTVDETDALYPAVHDWVLQLLPPRRQRSLTATTRHRGRHTTPHREETPAEQLRFLYSDRRARQVMVDGHRIFVQFEESEGGDSSGSSLRDKPLRPARLAFGALTHAGQQAIVDRLDRLHSDRMASRKPLLRMVTSWGSWMSRDDLPPRALSSVALPAEQKQRIVDDLRDFLAAEERYNHLAVPWHRGYMFHGPPGTGKTSLVKALASEFGLDLWYVGLSDLKAESGLMTLLSEVAPRSMLLLEDIDTIEITHDRDTQQGSISMSSLLNALDGVATPHGLVTVMTTNHFDKLDPALTRPGRMDVVERLDILTTSTLSDLFTHFYGRPLPDGYEPVDLSAAAAAEAFKRNLHDPDAALAALEALQPTGGHR